MTQVNTDYPGIPTMEDVAFNAANFSAVGGTWTVESTDIVTNQLIGFGGRVFLWIFRIATTTVIGTPSNLVMKLPGNRVALKTEYQYLQINPTSLPTEGGIGEILAGQNTMQLGRYAGNWVAGADLTYVAGAIWFTTA